MKTCIFMMLALVATSIAVGAQDRREREVREFLSRYDKAVADREVATLELMLAEDYVYTGASGRRSDRSRVLAFYKREKTAPSNRRISLIHDNVKIRAVGSMAVITNAYTSQTAPLDPPDAEVEITRGIHIVVFEKRKNRWLVIAEQDTEQPHDEKPMIQQVFKAGQAYNELMKRIKSGRSYEDLEKGGDIAALKQILADDYSSVNSDGEVINKTEELERYKTIRITLSSSEILEQNVRIIDNNTAVETGKIRRIGAKDGGAFDIAIRYTTTWVFCDGRWQIIAEHASTIK